MNRILLAADTPKELVYAIGCCLSSCEDKSLIMVGNPDVKDFPLRKEFEPIELKQYMPEPINVKAVERITGTSKENYNHRSKFHTKHL